MKLLVPNNRTLSHRENFFGDFDHLFNNFFEAPATSFYRLDADVQESEKYLLLSFDLPGLSEKDISLEIKDSHLTISGERKEEFGDDVKNHFKGRSFGSFKKTYNLAENLDTEKVEADYTQGVLKILIPKKEEVAAKKIEIQSKKGGLLSQFLKGKESA